MKNPIKITLDFVLDHMSQIEFAQFLNARKILIEAVIVDKEDFVEATISGSHKAIRSYLVEFYSEEEDSVDEFIRDYKD